MDHGVFYGRLLCNRERPLYFASSFFQALLSPPSLHRFSRNFATQRTFVGNRKRLFTLS